MPGGQEPGSARPPRRPRAACELLSRRHLLHRSAAYAGGALALPGGLAACAGEEERAREVSWSVWGNPGEIGRFEEFTAGFNQKMKPTRARLVPVPADSYLPRLLTQLGGGTATDLFYVYDHLITTLIEAGLILPLTDRLASARSHSRVEDFFDSTWGAARTPSGEIYGVPVDCNPHVVWYNVNVLRGAGVETMPAELFETGRWTIDAFHQMTEKVRASGATASALADDSVAVYSWMTARGGSIFADGEWVVPDDPVSTETFEWLVEMLRSKRFIYAGSLPEGQGQEALFMSNKLGFAIQTGRQVLPLFRENTDLAFDIVPYPSEDGSMSRASIGIAYMSINAEASDPERAFDFLTRFVSRRGQTFRLGEQGNAVPTIRGADSVLDGELPAHGHYFAKARGAGYGMHRPEASVLGLNTAIKKRFGRQFAEGGSPKQTLAEIAHMVDKAVKNGSLA